MEISNSLVLRSTEFQWGNAAPSINSPSPPTQLLSISPPPCSPTLSLSEPPFGTTLLIWISGCSISSLLLPAGRTEETLLWSVLAVHSLRRMNLNLIRFFPPRFPRCCWALPPLLLPRALPLPLLSNNGHAVWSCTLWGHFVDDIDDINDPSLAPNWNSLFDLPNCCYLFMLLSVPRALQFLPFSQNLLRIGKRIPEEFQSKSQFIPSVLILGLARGGDGLNRWQSL